MKRKTITKLLAAALSAAPCVPILLAEPISAAAKTVSGSTVSGSTVSESNGNGSSSATTAVTNNVFIGGKRVASTIGGIFTATSVNGVAITTPKENLAAAVGLSEADVKAGTNVRSYICDNHDKASKAALQSAAEAAGKTVAGYINIDLYTITKKGVVTKVTSSTEPVTITLALPGRLAKTNNNFSIIAIDQDGKTVVMDDVDTDPKTITINTKVFGAYSIVY